MYMEIIPTECDCCGKMVSGVLDKSNWFGKYLGPDEEQICFDCIKDRPGYREEFLEKIGVPVERLGKLQIL